MGMSVAYQFETEGAETNAVHINNKGVAIHLNKNSPVFVLDKFNIKRSCFLRDKLPERGPLYQQHDYVKARFSLLSPPLKFKRYHLVLKGNVKNEDLSNLRQRFLSLNFTKGKSRTPGAC